MEQATKSELPPIPAKRYFTIGEVSELCDVKPHVLRYWEQEFTQLKPVKRRGNRRYYQHHEVLLIRRIRELLYENRYTIDGARHILESGEDVKPQPEVMSPIPVSVEAPVQMAPDVSPAKPMTPAVDLALLRVEIKSVLELLRV